MAVSWLLFLFANCLLLRVSFAANAAFNKTIEAYPSCGDTKSELFYHISQAKLLPFLRKISNCSQDVPELAHPPEAMVDSNFSTFWQTEGGKDEARITIDLSGFNQKFYYVSSITISFGDYYRPGKIAYYKKSSGNFEPWHYLVTEDEECETEFGVPYKTIPSSRNAVLCTRYDLAALEKNENVTVGLEGGRGTITNSRNGELNTELLDWMNTTEVKLKFSGLRLFPDRLAKRWQHYVVREVQVEAYCHCNGHADGIKCPYNETTKDRECVCQGGTCGVQCGYCCPAYNQHPYKAGTLGPFTTDEKAACEKCNCHNHSEVCVYNETVANNVCSYDNVATNDECSMNSSGRYNGGGVCKGCKDHTEGINCQRCITKYYRNITKSHWDTDACQRCDCSQNGTKNTTRNGVEYLDCVRDDEEAAELGDLAPGQCLCKNKTTGRRCDSCVDGYYNLTAENPYGCLNCSCNTPGTKNASIDCTDDGVCDCKDRVKGDKCSQCENGTFNLADENQDGCTECVCSGITQNCTSSSLYRSKTKYDLDGWNLARGSERNELITVMNIQEEMNRLSVDLISANVSAGQLLYWTTNEDYFKGNSLVTSYGGHLEFTRKVSFLQNGTFQNTSLHIVIKGPSNITIEADLPQLNSTLQRPVVVSVKMVESGWKYHNTNTTVKRRPFMLVLSKPERMWITASYFMSGNGTYQTSFGNLHISSVSNTSSGNDVAIDVEQCSCGEAYQGSSCERCARGYHRVNVTGHAFFGQCISCNCHGHTEDCDPDTGKCLECQHNTTGFNCQICRDNFYGNARNGTDEDCQKCPCERPKADTKLCKMLPNGSAQCLNCSIGYEKNLECNRCHLGYYGRPFLEGGNCSICECNSNSGVCDLESGNCSAFCENNSTGWHCERCENGTYGDATEQQCRACTCHSIGSYDVPCDIKTGHCHCKPNVQGFNCSECEVNSYGFSDTGCQQCGCNEFGSVSLQCNNSGICECKNHTHGEKCDACLDYYYGLPNATCQECACNATGSNGTICDHVTGQCSCKPGVEGRQCDRCKIQHKDFSDAGCEPCPPCTMKLQRIVDAASGNLTTSKYEAEQANKSIDYFTELETLEGKIPGVKAEQEKHTNTIKRLEEYRKTLTNTTLNATFLALKKKESDLMSEARILNSSLLTEMERIGDISNKSERAYDYANDVNNTTQKIVDKLENLSTQSEAMNTSSSNAVRFLEQGVAEASLQTRRKNNVTISVEHISNKTKTAATIVDKQTEVIETLKLLIQQFNSELNETRIQIENDKSRMNTAYGDLEDVKSLANQTNATIQNTNTILKQISFYNNESQALMAEGETNYKNVRDTRLPELNQELDTLKNDIDNVNASYIIAKSLVENARQHADNLTAQANKLERIFSGARERGEKAVDSIKRYDDITKRINESLELSMEANKAVDELIHRIQNLTVASQSVNAKALECRNASITLLAQTKARDLNITEIGNLVSQVYQVFNTANETCSRVETSMNIYKNKLTLIISTAASDTPLIHSYIQNATNHVSKTHNISETIELESIELKKKLLEANITLAEVNTLVTNSSQLLESTRVTGNETAELLANISQSVNRTKQIKQENEQTEQDLLSRIAALATRLKAAKEKVAKFRLAMKVQGNTSVQYRPTQRMISNPLLNMISLDFKTNQSSGLLLYMSPSANNTHQSVSLKLVVDRVRFTYKIQSSPVVVTNWEVAIQNDVWYRIYATRYRDSGRLTVTNLASNFSRTYEGPKRIIADTDMNFNDNSSVFLGGLPSNENANFSERYFDGDLDNLVLNENEVSLWQPLAVEGLRRFAARRVPQDTFGFCDTFHGNGLIKQLAHDFDTRTNSSLAFQFRTFFKNAVMVMVEGNDKEFIYSVSLNNGRVIFHYNNTRLASARSDYDDGQWYDVDVTRSLKNASLHITYLGTGPKKGNDYVNESTRFPVYLPSAKYVYFGGANETGDRFAGGMKLVELFSIVQNRLVRRNLDDKNLTVESSGVAFDQCLRDPVERGLSYSNGYSAVTMENLTSMTLLTITFKTREPSGLLAYSVKENLHFYLALFHGNAFFMYANGSTDPLSLHTQTETLNDGAYHTVEIEIQNSRIKMNVDRTYANPGETVSRDLQTHVLTSFPLEILYIGGIPSSIAIPLLVPVLGSYNGDISQVQINGNTLLDGSSSSVFTSAVSVGVSAAGVSPRPRDVLPTQLPTNTPAPPTCGSKYPEKIRSEKQDEVHFEGIDSVLALNANRTLINDMALSFVISIEFRSLSPNGVLFLAADNQTSQFVSLELVDGNLVYQFNTGSGLVRMRTAGIYTVGGVWYEVDLLRIKQFGAMVVRQTKEYHKNRINDTDDVLSVSNVFVGGVDGAVVETSVLENPKAPSFFGCIREVSIQTQSATQEFNLSGDSIPDQTRNIHPGQCFDYVQPQVSFDGSGFAKLGGRYDMSAGSELSIRFRTTKRDGLLFFATNQNGSHRMAIEEVNGQIFLSYIHNSVQTTLQWTDPDMIFPENINNSYALCDNIYHTVNVRRTNDLVEMNVDGKTSVSANITDDELNATVYVGGIPSDLHVNVGVTGQRFVGCVESVHINQHVVDFKHETAEQEFMEYGCRAPISPQQSYSDLNIFKVMLFS